METGVERMGSHSLVSTPGCENERCRWCLLLGWHTQSAVQANGLAVEKWVLDDRLHEMCVLVRITEA
jgi:hypothetical protein